MAEWTTFFEYTEANVKKFTPTGAGVYRLCYKKDDKYYVFYIGQSDSLERRLLEHLSSNEENICIKKYLRENICYMQWVTIPTQGERDRIEEEQASQYTPVCNKS